MRNRLFYILIAISSVTLAQAEQVDNKPSLFKHKKCGYELSLPKGWEGDVEDEADDLTRKTPSLENAFSIGIGWNKTYKCIDHKECALSVYCHSLITKNEYVKYFDTIHKLDTGANASKARWQEFVINGQKFGINLTVASKYSKEFSTRVYAYCEPANVMVMFARRSKYTDVYKNMEDIMNKPISLESLFSKEQLGVINSVKCPSADFSKKSKVSK